MAKQLLPDTAPTSAPPAVPPTPTDSDVGTNNRMRRAVCPINPEHPGATVYSTKGRTRWCKCNTCGNTWKQTAPAYTKSQEWAAALADNLEKEAGRPSQVGARSVVVLDLASCKAIVSRLREIAGAEESTA